MTKYAPLPTPWMVNANKHVAEEDRNHYSAHQMKKYGLEQYHSGAIDQQDMDREIYEQLLAERDTWKERAEKAETKVAQMVFNGGSLQGVETGAFGGLALLRGAAMAGTTCFKASFGATAACSCSSCQVAGTAAGSLASNWNQLAANINSQP